MSASVGYGCESMVGKIERVLVRRPDETACAHWARFGWRAPPDYAALIAEHEALAGQLESAGASVVFGGSVAGALDSIYVFDSAIVSRHGAIVLRSGKELRRLEAAVTSVDLGQAGVPVVSVLGAPAAVDGGDTTWLDERTLLVGRGYRTNAAGADALRAALPGVEVIEFDLPHHRGAAEVMHLMSLFSLVDHDTAVAYLPLMPVRLVELLQGRGVRLIEVPDEEFETMGPNVLALQPGVVLALERNRETRRRLERAGVDVLIYAGVELSKGDGGPTCLTRPLLRG
jgi:dimethylargininase